MQLKRKKKKKVQTEKGGRTDVETDEGSRHSSSSYGNFEELY